MLSSPSVCVWWVSSVHFARTRTKFTTKLVRQKATKNFITFKGFIQSLLESHKTEAKRAAAVGGVGFLIIVDRGPILWFSK